MGEGFKNFCKHDVHLVLFFVEVLIDGISTRSLGNGGEDCLLFVGLGGIVT